MKNMVRDPYIRSHVIQTMILRLNEKEAQYYFEKQKIDMTPKTWYKCKKLILGNRYKRVREIFDYDFIDQYLLSIETIKDCIAKLYKAHEEEDDPHKKAEILTQVINAQPLLIEFYHNVKEVITKDKANQIIQNLGT